MLDWLFEAIVGWMSKTATQLMDAVSGLFLSALGTDMLAMEEYFPFLSKAFTVMQYTAWTLLFLITVWQLFRTFSGPLGDAEEPWMLLLRSALFACLIGVAKPLFLYVLEFAKAPYMALMDLPMGSENFTFAGMEQVLKNGLVTIVSSFSSIGPLLIAILMIALGWNYFKLLLEVVERYVVVGILCYTSPLAYAMGGSKATGQVFRSWCRMIGSQLLLLVMNVWFLRGFNSTMGYFVANGGALSNGQGSIFLWLFCALAFLKTAQKFDSYLASIGLSVAQTGSGLGMELLMAVKTVSGLARGFRSGGRMASEVSRAGAPMGFGAGFVGRFRPNSFVRDASVDGGVRMGAGGSIGFVGRMFGGMAARNGATLNGSSVSSVAARTPDVSGSIGGDIANRSLSNYLPHLDGRALTDTMITGGHITTSLAGEHGNTAVEWFAASQYEKPDAPCATVSAFDGSRWYQMACGVDAGDFYLSDSFPLLSDGVQLREVDGAILEATDAEGNTSLWYNSAYYDRPDAPHSMMTSNTGVDWYATKPNAAMPVFEADDAAYGYNQATFKEFMPGYDGTFTTVDGAGCADGYFEIRHTYGSGTRFYDSNRYAPPRGRYQIYEDHAGHGWYAICGDATVEYRPVFADGQPVYDGDSVRIVKVDTVRYHSLPNPYAVPLKHEIGPVRAPKRKR